MITSSVMCYSPSVYMYSAIVGFYRKCVRKLRSSFSEATFFITAKSQVNNKTLILLLLLIICHKQLTITVSV